MSEFEHAERLTTLFGHWPDFHDAELRALRLDAAAPGGPVLEADVDVAEPSAEVDERGYYRVRQSARTTLRFHNVAGVALDEFRAQNVLDAIVVRRLPPEEAAALGDPWGAQSLAVDFQPIPGFCSVSFRCDRAEVAAAESTLEAT
jgi:hypothetical protein